MCVRMHWKIYLAWRVAKCNKVKWTKQSEVEWGEVKCSIGGGGGGGGRVFIEKFYRSSSSVEGSEVQ
jgi:hypothetical protein